MSLVAILDADKQGFLRSETALIQTTGRAARNIDGRVIMYADRITKAMETTIDETNRRREIQNQFNIDNNITPRSIVKGVRDIIEATVVAEDTGEYVEDFSKDEIESMIIGLESAMMIAAEELDFEKAADLRDQITNLKKKL